MTIFEYAESALRRAVPTSFRELGIRERQDLQRLLRHQVDAISPDTFVITEEFGQWEDAARRIDLLAVDRNANLVVIELKRTDDGGHMELQAIRYASMVSTMTFDQVVEAHRQFRERNSLDGDPSEAILAYLGWTEPDNDRFANDVRIVLASEDFSKEITTAVMWLNTRGLDIRCVRMKPYKLDAQVLLDVQQVIPLPEASEYQVRVREKALSERSSPRGEKWTEDRFMEAIRERKGEGALAVAVDLLRWSEKAFGTIGWGNGSVYGTFIATPTLQNEQQFLFAVTTSGSLEVYFQWLAYKPPFSSEALRHELRERLNLVPGVSIPPEAINRRPVIPLSLLADAFARGKLKEAFEWALAQIQAEAR